MYFFQGSISIGLEGRETADGVEIGLEGRETADGVEVGFDELGTAVGVETVLECLDTDFEATGTIFELEGFLFLMK